MTDRKFEMKIEGVRFIGHPTNLVMPKRDEIMFDRYRDNDVDRSNTMIHVVFALSTNTSYSLVELYHELSKKIALCLRAEEW